MILISWYLLKFKKITKKIICIFVWKPMRHCRLCTMYPKKNKTLAMCTLAKRRNTSNHRFIFSSVMFVCVSLNTSCTIYWIFLNASWSMKHMWFISRKIYIFLINIQLTRLLFITIPTTTTIRVYSVCDK